jgi:hypothetical protein
VASQDLEADMETLAKTLKTAMSTYYILCCARSGHSVFKATVKHANRFSFAHVS